MCGLQRVIDRDGDFVDVFAQVAAVNRALQSVRAALRWGEATGGDRPRVANNPPVILADEPTANLDSAIGRQVARLRQLATQDHRAVVIVSHDTGTDRRPGAVAGGRHLPGTGHHGHRPGLRHDRLTARPAPPAARRHRLVVLLYRLQRRVRRRPRPLWGPAPRPRRLGRHPPETLTRHPRHQLDRLRLERHRGARPARRPGRGPRQGGAAQRPRGRRGRCHRHVGNLDGQLEARPAGPGQLCVCAKPRCEMDEVRDATLLVWRRITRQVPVFVRG